MDGHSVRERQEGATDDLPETAPCLWKSGDCGCSRNGSPCGMPSPQRHAAEPHTDGHRGRDWPPPMF